MSETNAEEDTPNAAQRHYWNADPGRKWLVHEDALEALHAPMIAPLLEAAGLAPGHRVLDVGCGSGALSRAAAARVGRDGHVTALDISEPLLKRAAAIEPGPGAAPVETVLADAQVHAFAPGRFDRVVSRLGVMFFDDPLAAFANLRRAAAPGAVFAAIAWRAGTENPWFSVPGAIAARRLQPPPPDPAAPDPAAPDPAAPGPLAFADIDRACGLLERAGWQDVRARALPLDLVAAPSAAEAGAFVCRLGPAARMIDVMQPGEAEMQALRAELVEALAAFEGPDGVRLPTVMTLFTARVPG